MGTQEIAEELQRIFCAELYKGGSLSTLVPNAWQEVATAVFLELHSCKCRTRYWEGEFKRLERGEKPIELMEKYKNLKLTVVDSLDISKSDHPDNR